MNGLTAGQVHSSSDIISMFKEKKENMTRDNVCYLEYKPNKKITERSVVELPLSKPCELAKIRGFFVRTMCIA